LRETSTDGWKAWAHDDVIAQNEAERNAVIATATVPTKINRTMLK